MNIKEKCMNYLKTKNIKVDKFHASIESEFKMKKDEGKENENDNKLYIHGYITTFENIDREGDVVDKSAFNKTIEKFNFLPILRNHTNRTQDQMGVFTSFKIDDIGLFAEGFISDTPETLHERILIKDGALNSFSMGALCKYESNLIEDIILLEASIVPIPANEKAKFTIKTILEKSKIVPLEEIKESINTRIARLKKQIRRT